MNERKFTVTLACPEGVPEDMLALVDAGALVEALRLGLAARRDKAVERMKLMCNLEKRGVPNPQEVDLAGVRFARCFWQAQVAVNVKQAEEGGGA